MTLKFLFAAAALIAAIAGNEENQALGHESGTGAVVQRAVRRETHLPVADFSLTDQAGMPFSFRLLKGKVVLVAFVYTTCPDICPLITATMRLVQEGLKEKERESVFFLSITTDPEVDHPQVLKSYARRYGVDFSNWSFLTGELPKLVSVWKLFGVRVQRKGRGLVDHTALTALIDAQGVMRLAYTGAWPDHKSILQDIRFFLGAR